MTKTTRELVREFSLAFGRPVNDRIIMPSVSDRLLLGKLLLEETLETVTKGLGLTLTYPGVSDDADLLFLDESSIGLEHLEGQRYDPIETFDGLGDTNVVIHFTAHWLGGNLDAVTEEINDSNMSKLDHDGRPIINGVTPGYEGSPDHPELADAGFDPTQPIGKILKGPNFWKPDIEGILMGCWNKDCPFYGVPGHSHVSVHIDSGEVRDSAKLPYCKDHPDADYIDSFGLAGGGFGSYKVCNECGSIFGKINELEDGE